MTTAIQDRVGKLLRLANSGTEGERLAAAAAAQKLITKYRIDPTSIDPEETHALDYGTLKRVMVEQTGRVTRWKVDLLKGIARANLCYISITQGCGITVYGHEANLQTVRYLYQMLIRQVDDMAKQHAGRGRLFIRCFREGMAKRIGERLIASTTKAAAESRMEANSDHALVRVDEALAKALEAEKEAEALMKKNVSGAWKIGPRKLSLEGREAGRKAGDEVHLGGEARGGLAAPKTQLNNEVQS